MKTMIAIFAVGSLIGCAQHSQQTARGGFPSIAQTGAATSEDSAFARQACQSGAVQMHLGKLAQSNTRNKELRRFANRLAKDHAQAEKELSELFARKQMARESEINSAWQSSLQTLADLKGREFDQEFKNQVVAAHESAIIAFEKQAATGSDPDLQVFAQRHLPRLRAHLETAQNLPISSDTDGPPADNFTAATSNPTIRATSIPR